MNETAGLGEQLEAACRAVGEQIRLFAQAVNELWYGVEIKRSALVPRGKQRRIEPGEASNHRVVIYMHPLDAISRDNQGDPITEIEEAAAWITERAHAELDALIADAGNRAMLGAVRQQGRLYNWLIANDLTEYDLLAARMRKRWAEEDRTLDGPMVIS